MIAPGIVSGWEYNPSEGGNMVPELPSPRRIVSIDPATVDLARVFPHAIVRTARPGEESDWAGWPDLTWFGLALTEGDAERLVRSAWRAMPDGALVAAITPETDPRVVAVLRECFAALGWLEPHTFQATSRVFLGVKVAERDW